MSNYTLFVQRVLTTSSLCIAAGYLASSPAQALQFNFNNITHNNAVNESIGERQLLVDVTDSFGKEDLVSNNVLFKFSNVGPFASSMTQIYFDNSTVLKNMGTIVDSGAGVDFAAAAGKMNLPGGNTVNFSPDFAIKSTGAVSQNGVNPGEWVSVFFNLSTNKTLKDVFNDLKSGSLRVGMHVQAFSNGGSEAFVNNNTPVVTTTLPPVAKKVSEPGITLVLGIIAGKLVLRRRTKAII